MDVSLKEYCEAIVLALDKRLTSELLGRDDRVQLALTANKEAVTKSEQQMEKRLKLLNEFRAQAAEMALRYAQIDVVDKEFKALEDKIVATNKSLDDRLVETNNVVSGIQGRMISYAAFGAVSGGILVGLVMRILGGLFPG